MQSFSLRSLSDTLARCATRPEGLSETEAAQRLASTGPNEFAVRSVGPFAIIIRQARSPFLYLLGAAAGVSFVLREWADGGLILLFILVNVALGFIQEYRSEKALQALRKFVVPTARVRRGGVIAVVPTSCIVVGDIVVVSTGDALPADIRWVKTSAIEVNESILTGESVAVEKRSDELLPPGLEENAVAGFASTIVVRGEGEGIVVATGGSTRFGAIAAQTLATDHPSGFEHGLTLFSRAIIKLMLGVVAALLVINIAIKGTHIDIPELVLFSIALAVTVVPEALPVVTTVAFSRGALRLAKNHLVAKRLSAVEDLGSIEVLCTDKTGTITENTLSVAEVRAPDVPRCVSFSALASATAPKQERESSTSFDEALLLYVRKNRILLPSVRGTIAAIPFDPVRRRSSILVDTSEAIYLIVRGAPEELSSLCNLSASDRSGIAAAVTEVGARGERTLGCAYKIFTDKRAGYSIEDERDLTWLGFVSFRDPIKPTARQALAEARRLGVPVKILTGDHADVAEAVAREIGLVTHVSEVITGPEFSALRSDEQRRAVLERHVFARVDPSEKFLIIQRLQEQGKEVGFLGEGINDAPALKLAEVGIVVQGASDLAREAADIVLLESSLHVIVDGIRQGREIFENVIKYIKITLIGNFGNFFTLAMVSLLLPYVPLLPIQILLLNILTDIPLIAIATDKVDRGDLKRPRSYNLREIVIVATVLGLVSSVFDFALFGLFVREGATVLRTAWFITSALAEFVVIFLVRSRHGLLKTGLPSRTILLLIAAALSALFACYAIPAVRNLFLFTPLTGIMFAKIAALTVGYALATEIAKCLYYRHARRLV